GSGWRAYRVVPRRVGAAGRARGDPGRAWLSHVSTGRLATGGAATTRGPTARVDPGAAIGGRAGRPGRSHACAAARARRAGCVRCPGYRTGTAAGAGGPGLVSRASVVTRRRWPAARLLGARSPARFPTPPPPPPPGGGGCGPPPGGARGR